MYENGTFLDFFVIVCLFNHKYHAKMYNMFENIKQLYMYYILFGLGL